jgi:hypothetical protein
MSISNPENVISVPSHTFPSAVESHFTPARGAFSAIRSNPAPAQPRLWIHLGEVDDAILIEPSMLESTLSSGPIHSP